MTVKFSIIYAGDGITRHVPISLMQHSEIVKTDGSVCLFPCKLICLNAQINVIRDFNCIVQYTVG